MPKRKLSELHPRLKRHTLSFVCPTSFDNPDDKDHDGHSILVPFHKNGLTKDIKYVWRKTGDSIENITLAPSIDCTGSESCKFHGFVQNGIVKW